DAVQLYFTRVHAEFQVDTHFPKVDLRHWDLKSAVFHPPDERNPYPFTFFVYNRKR
ncbi:MAG TPA: dihydrofolate reductase, partial [Anaerolineales bacterium]|nr:dihydrofolate reductase [Anaerolineales bacterium]